MGGMAMSLFFQGGDGDGVGGSGGGVRRVGENDNDNDIDGDGGGTLRRAPRVRAAHAAGTFGDGSPSPPCGSAVVGGGQRHRWQRRQCRGGARGRRHLQNDGDRRGRDPLGSNKSLEEEEDDDGYGTPAGAPDLTATVRRHGSLHIQQRERRGDGGGGEKEEEAPEDDGICRVAGRGGEGRGGGTTVIITTCRTSGGRRRGPCTG